MGQSPKNRRYKKTAASRRKNRRENKITWWPYQVKFRKEYSISVLNTMELQNKTQQNI